MCATSVSLFRDKRPNLRQTSCSVAFRKPPILSPDVNTSTALGHDVGEKGLRGSLYQSFAHRDSSHVLATMLSWTDPFVGEAHKLLYDKISEVCTDTTIHQNIYARCLAVVQSSGMGKSRMIDELSKEHFVIPINLRTTGTGMVFFSKL